MKDSFIIESIEARSINDSRGRPTIEVQMSGGGHTVVASVPSGKSAGTKEAVEKRDADGQGVQDAIAGLQSEVIPQLVGTKFASADDVDTLVLRIDGTDNKSKLGANATLGISFAATKLFAAQSNLPVWKFIADSQGFTPAFPRLYMNVLNGGSHADFCMPFQEYILVVGGDGMRPLESYVLAQELFDQLGETVKNTFGDVPMGDEGGYSPTCATVQQPFELLEELIADVHSRVFLAIDAAASEFHHDGSYVMLNENLDRKGLLSLYAQLSKDTSLRSIEDPFVEDDVEGFTQINGLLGHNVKIVGDDYTVTNPTILADRIERQSGNALIVKPNQIGTLKEVYETVRMADKAGWECIASHRSGETEETIIADIAVAIGAYGLKAGAPTQKERRVKYERLLEIEKEVG
jgi:enolase